MDITSINNIQLIKIQSSIHSIEAEILEKKLNELYNRGEVDYIIDLSEVLHICSSALGILVSFKREVSKHQGDVKLIINNDYIMQLFEITMLDKVFETHKDTQEALESFGQR